MICSSLFEQRPRAAVRASYDWPIGIALAMAAAAIELGDDTADMWIERAEESAASCRLGAGAGLAARLHRSSHGVHAGGAAVRPSSIASAPRWRRSTGSVRRCLPGLQRERLTAVAGRVGMPSGRVRTVMFTDIVDSTRLMASAGNAAWAVILGEHHRIVRTVVGRFRGSIMTATGDGFSAWFEQPGDAVDAASALHQAIEHAALVVPGGSVRVRVGLASGSVFDLGADASGMAVAEAARVMSTAGAGETHCLAVGDRPRARHRQRAVRWASTR